MASLTEGRILLSSGSYEEALRALERSVAGYESVRQIGRYSAEGYLGVAMIQLGRHEAGVGKMQGVIDGLEAMGRMQSARYGHTMQLGGLARLGQWEEWEESFGELEVLVNARMFGAIYARICEMCLPHMQEVGDTERTKRVARLLYENYVTQGIEHEQRRYADYLETLGLLTDVVGA